MKDKIAYIVADLEGSTGAWTKAHTLLATPEWQEARVELTQDINAVIEALFAKGVRRVVGQRFPPNRLQHHTRLSGQTGEVGLRLLHLPLVSKGRKVDLGGKASFEVKPGERVIVETLGRRRLREGSMGSLPKTRIFPSEKNPLPVLAPLSSRQAERNRARYAAEGFRTDPPEPKD